MYACLPFGFDCGRWQCCLLFRWVLFVAYCYWFGDWLVCRFIAGCIGVLFVLYSLGDLGCGFELASLCVLIVVCGLFSGFCWCGFGVYLCCCLICRLVCFWCMLVVLGWGMVVRVGCFGCASLCAVGWWGFVTCVWFVLFAGVASVNSVGGSHSLCFTFVLTLWLIAKWLVCLCLFILFSDEFILMSFLCCCVGLCCGGVCSFVFIV